MSPVGGSRHYGGPGLGDIGMWRCPSCGADNGGPLTQGCQLCGAGKPLPPPAPAPAPAPDRRYEPRSAYELGEPTHSSGSNQAQSLPEYQAWVTQRPHATLEDAYMAGYVEGIAAARRAERQPPAREVHAPEGKTYRTLVAALSYFRDQFLAGKPEEVRTGEWLSVEEANAVIAQLQETLTGVREEEDAHAVQSR